MSRKALLTINQAVIAPQVILDVPAATVIEFTGKIEQDLTLTFDPKFKDFRLSATDFLAAFGFQLINTIETGLREILDDEFDAPASVHLENLPSVPVIKELIEYSRQVGVALTGEMPERMKVKVAAAKRKAYEALLIRFGATPEQVSAGIRVEEIPRPQITVASTLSEYERATPHLRRFWPAQLIPAKFSPTEDGTLMLSGDAPTDASVIAPAIETTAITV